MSTTIDHKVVEMKFDNQQFERGCKESINTLDKLKKSLKLEEAAKGLDSINTSASKMNLGSLGDAVENVSQKFSALEVMGVTALATITNRAVDAGINLVKSLSVDNIMSGWTKFNEMTSSTATLLSQGFLSDDVEKQLDRLNWFTDETSYNLTDMVNSIGMFTSKGWALEDASTAMQGIALWAAMSGKNAQAASSAMYQLSQVSGYATKKDWMSIQTLNMDTKQFREEATKAAVQLGVLKDNGNSTFTALNNKVYDLNGLFGDGMANAKWLTNDVLQSAYKSYSAAVDAVYNYTKATKVSTSEAFQIIDEVKLQSEQTGLSIVETIDKMYDGDEALKTLCTSVGDFGITAFKAGQEARTFGDVISSVQDAVSTGWMNTFRTLIGNSTEATQLFTDLANVLWEVFNSSAEARNNMLLLWKDNGGRRAFLNSISNILSVFINLKEIVSDAFVDVFGELDDVKLVAITKNIEAFTRSLLVNEETANNLKDTFKGVFSILDLVKTVAVEIIKAMIPGIKTGRQLIDVIIAITGGIGRLITNIVAAIKESGAIEKAIRSVQTALLVLISIIAIIAIKIVEIIGKVAQFVISLGNIDGAISKLQTNFPRLAATLDTVVKHFRSFIESAKQFVLIGIPTFIVTLINAFKNFGNNIIEIRDKFLNFLETFLSLETISAKLEYLGESFKNLRDKILDLIGNDNLKNFFKGLDEGLEKIKNGFETVKQTLTTFASKITPAKVASALLAAGLFAIAVSIARLNSSLADAASSISGFFSILRKCLMMKTNTYRWISELGIAIGLLAASTYVLAKIPKDQLWSSIAALASLSAILLALGAASAALTKWSPELNKAGITLVAFSGAIALLAASLVAFNYINMENIKSKIIVLGVIMAEFAIAIQALRGFKGGSIKSILMMLAFALAMKELVSALAELTNVDIQPIMDNLSGIAVLMAMFAGLAVLVGNVGIGSAVGLLATVYVLKEIAPELEELAKKDYSKMIEKFKKYYELLQNVVIIAGAMAIVAAFTGKGVLKFGAGIIAITAGIYALTKCAEQVVKFLETTDAATLSRAVGAITMFGNMILAMEALAFFTKESKMVSFAASLILISGVIALLISIAALAGNIDPTGTSLRNGTIAVGAMLVLIGLLEFCSAFTSKSKVLSLIPLMATVMTVMGCIFALLTFISGDNMKSLADAALEVCFSISLVLVAISALLKSTSKKVINNYGSIDAWKGMLAGVLMLGEVIAGVALLTWITKDADTLMYAIMSVSAILIEFSIALGVMALVTKKLKNTNEIKDLLRGMSEFSLGISLILASMALLSTQPFANILTSLGSVSLVMVELVAIVLILQKKFKPYANQLDGILAVIKAMTLSILNIGISLSLVANNPWQNILSALAAVGGVFAELAIVASLLSEVDATGNMYQASIAVLAMSLSLIPIAAALKIVAGETWESITPGLASMGIAIGVLSGIAFIFAKLLYGNSSTKFIAATAGILVVSVSLIPVAAALKMLAGEDWNNINSGLKACLIAIGVLSLIMAAIAAISAGTGGMGGVVIAAAAASVLLLCESVLLLGKSMEAAGEGVRRFAEGVRQLNSDIDFFAIAAGVAAVVNSLSGLADMGWQLLGAGAGFLLASEGIKLIAEAILILSTVDIESLIYSFTTLMCSVVASQDQFQGLAMLIQSFADALGSLAMPFVAISFGCINMAAALLVVSAAIVVAAVGLGLLSGVLMIIEGLDLSGIALGLSDLGVAILGVAAAGVVMIGGAIGYTLCAVGIGGLAIAAALLNATNLDKIATDLTSLAEAGLVMAQAGINMISGAIGVAAMGVSLVVLGTYGSSAASIFQQSANSIETSSKQIVKSSKWSVSGFVNGIVSALPTLAACGAGFATSFYDAVQSTLIINSPSEKLRWIGNMTGLGFLVGIADEMDAAKEEGRAFSLAGAMGVESTADVWEQVGSYLGIKCNEGIGKTISEYVDKLSNIFDGEGGISSVVKDGMYEILGRPLGETQDLIKDMIPDVSELTSGIGDLTSATGSAGSAATKTKSAFEELTDSIAGQIDIFSEYSKGEEITADKMLENMRSQIQGVSNWAYNMTLLGQRGISQGLLEELGKLGPQGAAKVQAFVDMTQDQLTEANMWYQTSLIMPQAAAQTITNSYADAGKNASLGYANGIDVNAANKNMIALAQNSLTSLQNILQIHSPSRVTYQFGEFVVKGLANGIAANNAAQNQSIIMAKKVVDTIKQYVNTGNGSDIGKNIVSGIANGIRNAQHEAIQAARDLASSLPMWVRKVLNINSPSKVFEEIGMYSDLGLAKGLNDYSRVVESASEDVANSTINSFNDSIEDIASMDLNPVITPTLDLSYVEADAKRLNSMFGTSPTIDATVDAINQNGSMNNALISELKTEIINLGNRVSSMQMVLDTGVLVGEITPGINSQLGMISTMQRRGI